MSPESAPAPSGSPAADGDADRSEPSRLRVLGCGDAFGSGGRLHTCFLLESGEHRSLVDCGASALISLKKFAVSTRSIRSIVVSHLHGDHFGGLPFFLLDAHYRARRTEPLVVAGPPGLEQRLHEVQEALYPSSTERELAFPVHFLELEAGVETTLEPLKVTPYEVVHPSGAPSYALRIETPNGTLSFSGDTEWTDVLLDVSADSDLFLCECMSYDQDVPFHLSYRKLQEEASRLTARRTVLTHLGDEMLERRNDLDFECAEEGRQYLLGGSES